MDFPAPVRRASQPEPRIPLDIQLAIVDMCPDPRTRLRLISTHKALRYRGARLALQLPPPEPVRLHCYCTVHSFMVFCAAQGPPQEPSSPLSLLRTLDIDLASVNPAHVRNMTIVLANVPRLTSLVPRNAERALKHQGALYAPLQRLRTLKSFDVQKAGAVTFRLVSEIASALEAIRIEPCCLDSGGFLNLATTLGPHRDTLTHVGVMGVHTQGDMDTFQGDIVFENVRELVIPLCFAPGASSYIQAFPNTVGLHVGTIHNGWERAMGGVRSENVAEVLLKHAGSLGRKADCWPSLERVRGGLFDLYIFGNSCSAAVLQIDGLIKSHWRCVTAVVKSHYPSILHLSVSSSLRVEMWEKYWRRMISVKYLILQFVVAGSVKLESLINKVIRAVGSFVKCETVFLDFAAKNDAAHSRLQGIDHLSLRRIVEDRQLGPFEIVVRSPVKTTYWCHRPDAKRKWVVRHMPAKTNFQTMHCFPKDYVTDDWL